MDVTLSEAQEPQPEAGERMRSLVRTLQSDRTLLEEASFRARAEALDLLGFRVLEPIQSGANSLAGRAAETLRQALQLKERLEEVDRRLFLELRREIRSGGMPPGALKSKLERYLGPADEGAWSEPGYDHYDAFASGLLSTGTPPRPLLELEPDMVAYQPTPARAVLDMLDRLQLGPEEVFYDLGSGLGQVALLAALLTGARARGVELDPAYCAYARRCARGLRLRNVEFLAVDARAPGYSDGRVFYLYTPFTGGIWRQVLGRLQAEATTRRIRVCTYGPCTLQAERESWLAPADGIPPSEHRVAIFRARPEPPDSRTWAC